MKLLIFILMLSLNSCATSPIATTDARLVSASSILSYEYTKYDGAKPQITIVRDTGITGSLCSIRIFVNGTSTADIDPSEKVELYLEEGEHILSIKYNGICGDGQLNETVVNLEKDAMKKYRISSGLSSGIQILPTAF